MMDQFRQTKNQNWIIIAPGAWPQRIKSQLQSRFGAGPNDIIHCYSNIYEATPHIMQSNGANKTVLVYVLVDNLPESEMQFFNCWRQNNNVRTIALSLAHRQKKLTQALARGADEAMIFNNRNGNKTLTVPLTTSSTDTNIPAQRETTVSDEPANSNATIDEPKPQSVIKNTLMDYQPKPKVTEKPAATKPEKTISEIKPENNKPVLTDEELNALLS